MNKTIYNLLNKSLIVVAFLVGIVWLSIIWILPVFFPSFFDKVVSSTGGSSWQGDEREFYTDLWPPTTP